MNISTVFLRPKLNVYPKHKKLGQPAISGIYGRKKRVSRMNTKIVLPEINAKRPNMEVQDKKKEKSLKEMSTLSRPRSFSCQSHEMQNKKKSEKKKINCLSRLSILKLKCKTSPANCTSN